MVKTPEQILSAAGIRVRPIQQQLIGSLEQAVVQRSKISLVHAETGVGKTLGYLSVLLQQQAAGRPSIVATSSHMLMRQIERELALLSTNPPGMYFGFKQYPSKSRIQLYCAMEHFSDDTLSYLGALENFDGTIDDFIFEYGEIPDEVDRDRLYCLSKEDSDYAMYERQNALKQQIIVTTHAAIISDLHRKDSIFQQGNISETILLIDEADAFLDALESAKIKKLSILEISKYLQEHCSTRKLAPLTDLVNQCSLLAKENAVRSDDGTKQTLTSLFNEVRRLVKGNEPWQAEFRTTYYDWMNYRGSVLLGSSEKKHYPQVLISNPFIAWNAGDYLVQRTAILISGTLAIRDDDSGMDWVLAVLHQQQNMGVCVQHCPEKFGSLTLSLAAADEAHPAVYNKSTEIQLSDRWLLAVATKISQVSGDILVLTSSHNESKQLAEKIEHLTGLANVIVNLPGESLRVAAQKFMDRGGILISATGHTGLNIAHANGDLAFQGLVITRIGMEPRDKDKILVTDQRHAERVDNGQNSQNFAYQLALIKALRRIRQSIGRCIRDYDHHGQVYIFDPRFPLWHDRTSKFAALKHAIPKRFTNEYQKASKKADELEVFF